MKVLVIGSGGREHALAWKLARSKVVSPVGAGFEIPPQHTGPPQQGRKLYCLPGNAGMGKIAERVPGSAMDINGAADLAERESIDLTVVGPESPLIAGIADEFAKRGLTVFGPSREAAQMEGSKVFAKRLMLDNGIPTGLCEVFDDPDKAAAYVRSVAAKTTDPIVVKSDGETAGKGVFVTKTEADALKAVDVIMRERAFGASGERVVIEEYLDGPEATFMCFVDGESFVPMVPSQDYKRALDDDQGPNTGGMGCYSPVPVFTDELRRQVINTIVRPALAALARRGIHYRGVLYVGLALTSKGPKVVEFNCRFGDPETQVVMPLLDGDLAQIALAVAEGRLDTASVNWYNKRALCVVMASGGYPGAYETGKPISGLEDAEAAGAILFHAGAEQRDGQIVTSGGRVLGVTALGDTYRECIDGAYSAADKIHFEGAQYRRDIGARLL